MTEPENHTLHLLREIREAIRATDTKVGGLDSKFNGLDAKIEDVHVDLKKRLQSLQQAMIGESILGRYTVAEVDQRLEALEKRLTMLEQR